MDLIVQIGIIFVSATILAYISKLFKQPMIPAYILAGLILVLTGLVEANSLVETISTLGIAFLLFLVGLEIDFKRISDVGLISTIGGSLLCILLFWIGFLVAGFLGFAIMEAIYIGLVIAFSSTMVVVKLLSDSGKIDTLHGRIALGILLVQDVFAILALFILSTLEGFSFTILGRVLSILLVIAGATYIASKYIFPLIFKYAAKTEELLFTTSVAVCLIFIGLFHYFGFSIAIGAFLAGLALANLPYNIEIISLIKPLRDFFAVIFFVALGMQLNLKAVSFFILPIIIFTVLIVLLKPFLIMIVTSLFGYKKRPAFLISMSLAQASEFSLILLVLGVSVGHISQNLFSSVVLITIVTMAVSPYIFKYESWMYKKSEKFLDIFEKVSERGTLEYLPKKKMKEDVILVGYDRLGYNIFDTLKKLKKRFIVVDYNPEVIRDMIKKKIPCMYGDVGDLEIMNRLDLKNIQMVISTIPNKEDSLMVTKKTKKANKKAIVMVTAMQIEDALALYDAGADYVILPHFLGGERVSLFLEEMKGDLKKVLNRKVNHIRELEKRHALGHKHPKRYRHK